MKILIIKFREIGDVLLSTPLIKNLKLFYPDATIDLAINSITKDMVIENPNINQLFLYDRKKIKGKNIFLKIFYEYKYIKEILENQYDLVINLTEGDRGAIISRLSHAKIRLGMDPKYKFLSFLKPYTNSFKYHSKTHAVERDLSFLTLLDLIPKTKKVELYFNHTADKKISDILIENKIEKFVIIHPVSRLMFKAWDDNKFAQIIDYIQQKKKYQVIVTASPDKKELQKTQNILTSCKSDPIDFSGKFTLQELSALLSKASLYLGVDTAPMHMAATFNIPVIALFGPSNPTIWGPWDNETDTSNYKDIRSLQHNGKHTIIQHPNDRLVYIDDENRISTAMMEISVDEVIAQIDKKL